MVRDLATEELEVAVDVNPVIENVGLELPLGGSGTCTPILLIMSLAERPVLVTTRTSLAPRRSSLINRGVMMKLCAAVIVTSRSGWCVAPWIVVFPGALSTLRSL